MTDENYEINWRCVVCCVELDYGYETGPDHCVDCFDGVPIPWREWYING